jgi:integrase
VEESQVRLTDKIVAEAQCPAGKKDVLLFDDALPGFGLRAAASGSRTFIFQYRQGSTVRRIPLGVWGKELTTAAARKKAETLRGQVRDHRDPVAERRAARAAALAAEAARKAAEALTAYTVAVLIDQWATHHLSERSASYRQRVPQDLRKSLAPWLADSAGSLTRTDAVRALDVTKAERGPVAANRLRAHARACWGWAVQRGTLEVNPWEATPRPAREVSRERVLSDAELAALWRAAGTLGQPWEPILRLLVLTGQRRGEVAGMRWDELDLDAGLWSLPGTRTKNQRPHTLPLSHEALEVLRTVKRRDGAELVFQGPHRNAPSGFGKVKARLDAAMVVAARQAGRPMVPWTLHDIRRTVATGLQRLGVRLEVTEALLNHVSGSRAGIVGVYQRHGWDREKSEALQAWAKHVLDCAEGKAGPGTVVPRPMHGRAEQPGSHLDRTTF